MTLYEHYLDNLKRLGYDEVFLTQVRIELSNDDPDRLEDVQGYLAVKLPRVLRTLETDEVEFLREEFVTTAMIDKLRPQFDDLEAYDFADLCHDEWEVRRYGHVVSSGSVSDD
jgi:hypothetical protein